MPDALRKQMPDAMHERTDELTNADLPHRLRGSLVERNARGAVYLVHWADAGFVKVGYTTRRDRWRTYLKTGGLLLGFAVNPAHRTPTYDAGAVEFLLHVGLTNRLGWHFHSRDEAAPFLRGGAGWTECYADDGSVSLPMFTECANALLWTPGTVQEQAARYWELRDTYDPPECRLHRGQLADHCGPCRSEQIGAA
jgi:hypothetical protein